MKGQEMRSKTELSSEKFIAYLNLLALGSLVSLMQECNKVNCLKYSF